MAPPATIPNSVGGEGPSVIFLALSAGGECPWTAAVPTGDGGVDLAAIGRALGLEPSSVRLNGYFLSRGPDLKSSVTWDTLVAFFSSRGLPVGTSRLDPVVVQGKPATAAAARGLGLAYDLEDRDQIASKRKVSLEDEHPHKKNKLNGSKINFQGGWNGDLLSDDDILSIKRRLKLDDDSCSIKKRKVTDSTTSKNISTSQLYFSDENESSPVTCFTRNASRKRLRPEDLIMPAVSCKRVRASSLCT